VSFKKNLFFIAEEWLSGQNALPLLMSLKSGTQISTYKPVVYPASSFNASVAANGTANGTTNGTVGGTASGGGSVRPPSDRNVVQKFAFLSKETVPDYRPVDRRGRGDGAVEDRARQAGRRPEPVLVRMIIFFNRNSSLKESISGEMFR